MSSISEIAKSVYQRARPVRRLKFALATKQRKFQFEPQESVVFCAMESVSERGELDTSNRRQYDDVASGFTEFANGDVVVAKITPCFENGKGALVDGLNPPVGFGTTELHVLSPSHELDGRYLYYHTVSSAFRRLGEAYMTGAAGQKRVPTDFVRDFPIWLPPLAVQRRIASYLDRETSEIDGLIAEKERMLSLLEEKRAALITHAVTRGLAPQAPLKPSGLNWLGDIPEHWKLWRLKFLADVRTGLTIGKNYGNAALQEYYYLRVANVQDGYLDLSSITTVEVNESDARSSLLQSGDVLMNEGGDIDKLGRGCVWRDEVSPCLHQNHVFCVRPHSVSPEWLATFTATIAAKQYFSSRAKRTTNLASISSSNIKELSVPIPPRNEQKTILRHVARISRRLDKTEECLQAAKCLLRERRSALITAAVTGQIPLEEMAE